MRRLLLASAALLAMSMSGNAAIINDLGPDPQSAQGDFHSIAGGVNGTGSGFFDDQFLFQLTQNQTITVASATNSFPGGNTTTDFITGFTASVFDFGLNGIFEGNLVGNGDDNRLLGPDFATSGCGGLCQNLFGVATMPAGSYYLDIAGTGGGTSGYGGNLATLAVPGPIVGAGLPGLLAAMAGLYGFNWRRRRRDVGLA